MNAETSFTWDFPIPPDSPYREGLERLRALIHEISLKKTTILAKHFEEAQAILAADERIRKQVALASLEVSIWLAKQRTPDGELGEYMHQQRIISYLRDLLFNTGLLFTEAEILTISQAQLYHPYLLDHRWPSLVELIANYKEAHSLTPPLRAILVEFQERSDVPPGVFKRIVELLGDWPQGLMEAGLEWTNAGLKDLTGMEAGERGVWTSLLAHAGKAGAGRPKPEWLEKSQAHLNAVGKEAFLQHITAWFTAAPVLNHSTYSYQIGATNLRYFKGLIWMCSLLEDPSVYALLSRLSSRYLLWYAMSQTCGNICIQVLGAMQGMEPVRELIRLQTLIPNRQVRKTIGKALEEAAQRLGLDRADLEEMGVPHAGLDADGCLRETIGDFTAVVAFTGRRMGEWNWLNARGKSQKSVPAAVKREQGEALKKLKKRVEEIQNLRLFQCDRIEFLLRGQHSWKLSDWQERYLDHPLLLGFAHRLIWEFRQADRTDLGLWQEGQIRNVRSQPIDWLTDATEVRLWHPVGYPVETILAWRSLIEACEIVQPFKQAHREAYFLTDAEITTGTYSNRFAAHIIRQWAFHKLCLLRGWNNRLRRTNDAVGDRRAILELPEWGLNAELWLDPIDDSYTLEQGGSTYNYLGTDQVRFSDPSGNPIPLTEVPPQAFYEVMRDVDLFIAATGIAGDTEWQDRGETDRLQLYWKRTAFGGLTLTAKTRREAVEKLLPRLEIASRCSLTDTFLVVRGDIRTYKIHLGSGNILMEPNDQYLCIIRDRSQKANDGAGMAYLPFEGDTTLAMILSKAFLLAADKNIKDPVILKQIQTSITTT